MLSDGGVKAAHSEDSDLRKLFLSIFSGMCDYSILLKDSNTMHDSKLKQRITISKFKININCSSLPKVSRCKTYRTPQNAVCLYGELYYIDFHCFQWQQITRKNRKSTAKSRYTNPGVFNELSMTPLGVDCELLGGNIEHFKKHNKISRLIDSSEKASAELDKILGKSQHLSKFDDGREVSLQYSRVRELYTLYLLKEELTLRPGVIYLRYFADFRGRLYPDCEPNFANSKVVRYSMMLFGDNAACRNHTLSEEDASLFKLYGCVYGEGGLSDFCKFILLRVLFEIGKVHKNEANGRASFGDLVRIGFLHFNDATYDDMEDEIVINYYKYVLGKAVELGTCPYPFFIDATASGLQILCMLLKPANDEVADMFNLLSEDY